MSNDPNHAIEHYQKCLADAGAPPFSILANGERIHQTRLSSALKGSEEGNLEGIALVLQNELSGVGVSGGGIGGGGGGGGVGGGSVIFDSSPVVHWAYYYAKKLPASFMTALKVEEITAVTAESLRVASFPEDLSDVTDLLKTGSPSFP